MHKKLVNITQAILNDEDLEHLQIRDLRNVIIHVQENMDDEEEPEEDLEKFVI